MPAVVDEHRAAVKPPNADAKVTRDVGCLTSRSCRWPFSELMRTTLNISAEAMAKVRQLAQQRARPLGEIVSELILEALRPQQAPPIRNGVPLFRLSRVRVPTLS